MAVLYTFAAYILIAGLVFYRTFHFVFRSDEWILYAPFVKMKGIVRNLWKIIAFEMFGDIRFFPLAHLCLFMQFRLFGSRTRLYRLTALLFHAANGLLVYLIINRLTGNPLFSLMSGALFLCLFTHFDAVTWTYHIYHVLFSTLLILFSAFLIIYFFDHLNALYAVTSFIVLGTALFFYETIVPLPLIFLCFFALQLLLFPTVQADRSILYYPTILVITTYLVYSLCYILFLKKEKNISGATSDYMSMREILCIRKFKDGIQGIICNYKMFLLNLGLPAKPDISDIVYLPKEVALSRKSSLARGLQRIYVIFILSSLIHLTVDWQRTMYFLMFVSASVSYLFLFIIGRNITYATTQPRYQYFFNAAHVIAFGILIGNAASNETWKTIHLCMVLGALCLANARNTMAANEDIANILKSLHKPYWILRQFIRNNLGAKIFIDMSTTPQYGQGKFFLGSDIAFDVLFFKDNCLTKDYGNADYVLCSDQIVKNRQKGKVTSDFVISFAFLLSRDYISKRQKLFGCSINEGLGVYLETDYHLSFTDGSNWQVTTDNALLKGTGWHEIIIEKQGERMAISHNGKITDIFSVDETLCFPDKPLGLLGDFYFGPRAPYYLTDLYAGTSLTKYGLTQKNVGEKITDEDRLTKETWWPNNWKNDLPTIQDYIDRIERDETALPGKYYESLYKMASWNESDGELHLALRYFNILADMLQSRSGYVLFSMTMNKHLLPGIFFHKARIYSRLNQDDNALENYFICLGLLPIHMAATHNLFQLICSLNDGKMVGLARSRLKSNIRRATQHIDDIIKIFFVFASGDNQEGLSRLQRFLDTTPKRRLKANGFNFLYKLASHLELQNRLEVSVEIFECLLKIIERCYFYDDKAHFESGIHYHLAQLKKHRRPDKATYHLDRCLSIVPMHQKALELRQELTDTSGVAN